MLYKPSLFQRPSSTPASAGVHGCYSHTYGLPSEQLSTSTTPKPYPTVWKLLGGASVVVAIGAHLYTLTTLTISGVQYVIEEGGKGEAASWSVSLLLAEATALSMLITATFIFFTFIARESFTHLNALYVRNVHANVRKINRAHSLYAQLEGNSVPDAVVEELDVMEVERQHKYGRKHR